MITHSQNPSPSRLVVSDPPQDEVAPEGWTEIVDCLLDRQSPIALKEVRDLSVSFDRDVQSPTRELVQRCSLSLETLSLQAPSKYGLSTS